MNRKGEKTSDVYVTVLRNTIYFCSDASWYANLCIVAPCKQDTVFHIMKYWHLNSDLVFVSMYLHATVTEGH